MKELGSKIKAAASLNNAGWCAAVWASHGLLVERAPGLLMTRETPPPFYPNAVTLNSTEVPQQMSFLATVSQPFAVKDSFGLLELEALGFRRLFEARWLWRKWEGTGRSTLAWRPIVSADGLAEWEQSRRDHTQGPASMLPPALITQPGVAILAGLTSRGRIAAGGVAYAATGWSASPTCSATRTASCLLLPRPAETRSLCVTREARGWLRRRLRVSRMPAGHACGCPSPSCRPIGR